MLKRLAVYITHLQYFSVGLSFFVLNVLFSFWITRIPEVKEYLDLSEGDLGIALFFAPVGGIISMLISTRLIKIVGEGRTTVLALLVYSAIAILPVLAVDYITLCLSLFALGFGMGWVDIAMNAVASTLEEQNGVAIMSTTHGFFSLGGIVGGSIGGVLAGMNVDAVSHMIIAGACTILLTILFINRHIGRIRNDSNRQKTPLFAVPRGALVSLAVICFCIMVGEGAVADWSTVYFEDFLNSSAYMAGIGYAAFSLTMTIGRFNGDYYIEKIGAANIVVLGSLLAIVGIILVISAWVWPVVIGFALIGLGYSCIVPVLFSSAAKTNDVSPAYGIASVASVGYFGFLIGPVAIGVTAEYFGLNNSFVLLLILTLLALILARNKV